MGLQVSRRIRTQAAAQSNLRADAPSTGADFPRAGQAERVPDCRRAPPVRPCAHVHCDSPQAPGGFGDRVSEREERYSHSPAVRQGAEFLYLLNKPGTVTWASTKN